MRKLIARFLYQDLLIRNAACLHVNSEPEASGLRGLGFLNPTIVLPVGVDLGRWRSSAGRQSPYVLGAAMGKRVLLYLARIHPTKGIELLIDAWKDLATDFPDWTLIVAGAGSAEYVAQIRARVVSYGLTRAISFLGFVSDDDKRLCYEIASLYVLPSLQENFGNSVAEALGNGIPVVTTSATPWRTIKEEGCGWICPPTSSALKETLRRAMSARPEALREMGDKAARMAQERYSTDAVIDSLEQVYEWLVGGNMPDVVRIR